MSLVVYAEGSAGTNPGHVVVGQEPAADAWRRYGFRFDPFDLPPDVQPPTAWRSYLFANKVPGYVVDENEYLRLLFAGGAEVYEKRERCEAPIETALPAVPPADGKVPYAFYAFNPDDFPANDPDEGCYNCVTWAVGVANRLLPNFLPVVRQGRVKLIVPHLRPRAAGTE